LNDLEALSEEKSNESESLNNLEELSEENSNDSESLNDLEALSNIENSQSKPSKVNKEFKSFSPNASNDSKSSNQSLRSLSSGVASINDNSHTNLSGGSNTESKKEVFFYDHHNKATVKELTGNKQLQWVAAEIKDFFRCMVKNYCTLVHKDGTTCRGAKTSLTDAELSKISMPGFILEQTVIFDKQGNKTKGYTFINKINKFELPPQEYIAQIYTAIKSVWADVEGEKKLYIYDNTHEMIGFYNGTEYIDKDDARVEETGHSNPFLKRLQEKEPTLFLKEEDEKFSQYSRMCPWNHRRQPVILTKEEKEEIDREAPGTYESAVEYGTDPANTFYYICPKYWNLRTNKPMLEKDVDRSKIIDQKLSKAKSMKDKFIFEFSTDKHGHYPLAGFLDSKKHPKGHFTPCCFKMKENPGVIKDYKELLNGMNREKLLKEIKKEKIKKGKKMITEEDIKDLSDSSIKNILIEHKMTHDFLLKRKEDASKLMAQERVEERTDVDKYIQNGLKFPLEKQRIGFLTMALERFFSISINDYYENVKTKKFKLNKPLLFRYGTEQDKNTSFLTAIGSILINMGIIKGNPLGSVVDYIKKEVTLENINEFHNGRLPIIFSDPSHPEIDQIRVGYNNFIEYINDTTKYVDYKYLWDIVCSVLFKKQINMIILYEPMDDITQNLSIICPTTHHSQFKFDINNPSIILYKKGDYFEPLFYAKKESKKKLTTIDPAEYNFLFEIKESFIAKILKSINLSQSGQCKEVNVNKKFNFKQNKSFEEIQQILPPEYSISSQVIGYDYTIIGIIIKGKIDFFVPCRPSSLIPTIAIIRIDDVKWNSYDDTVRALLELYKKSNKQIYCRPLIRVLEDTLIVGVLTMTNQFIQLRQPEEDEYEGKDRYGLDKIEEHNYIHTDRVIKKHLSSDHKDSMIHKLKLEKKFYSAYFNVLKIELNTFENFAIRQRIEEIIKSSMLYPAKIEQIKDLLEPIIEDKIQFITYSEKVLLELEDINVCKEETSYCTPDGVLLIPELNLYTNKKNNVLYLIKFVDGILRNHNVKISVFEQSHSTIYFTDKYNLTENELLLLESLLMPYLERLGKTIYSNDRVTYLSFEDLQPEEILHLADIASVEYESPGNFELPESNSGEDSSDSEDSNDSSDSEDSEDSEDSSD